MDPSVRQLLLWILTAGLAAAWGWLWRIERRANALEKAVAELRLHVAEQYPTNPEFLRLEDQVRQNNQQLNLKLDEALKILYKLTARQDFDNI